MATKAAPTETIEDVTATVRVDPDAYNATNTTIAWIVKGFRERKDDPAAIEAFASEVESKSGPLVDSIVVGTPFWESEAMREARSIARNQAKRGDEGVREVARREAAERVARYGHPSMAPGYVPPVFPATVHTTPEHPVKK